MDSPSQNIAHIEQDTAIARADLRSVAECTAMAQTAAIKDYIFEDICLQQYEIATYMVCMNESRAIVKCEVTNKRKPEYSFVVTTTAPLPNGEYNNMLEIIEKYYPAAGTFGIFLDDVILGGGPAGKRAIPAGVIKEAKLRNGQLVYMTMYEIPDVETDFAAPVVADITCGGGMIKAYRFGKWQCVPNNTKINCAGDKIWDSDLGECVADNARRPLCGSKQSAVMVDDIWQCIDPFQERSCPAGMIARLNYNDLVWECVEDPVATRMPSKCTPTSRGAEHGRIGATLRISATLCTDCEQAVLDQETCAVMCVPDPAKTTDPKCYPNASACTGSSRAMYFGFPSLTYAARVSAVADYEIPLDKTHSQNRKFNCLDCGVGRIDPDKSLAPYVAVCE